MSPLDQVTRAALACASIPQGDFNTSQSDQVWMINDVVTLSSGPFQVHFYGKATQATLRGIGALSKAEWVQNKPVL
jgi:hypothetical protein